MIDRQQPKPLPLPALLLAAPLRATASPLCVLILLTSTLVSGCANTETVTFANPLVFPKDYSRILVAFPATDEELRREVEDELVRSVSAPETVLPSYNVLDPEREYLTDELSVLLSDHGIDAVLEMSVSGSGVEPPSFDPRSTESCATMDPRPSCVPMAAVGAFFDARRPWATFISTLYDLDQGIIVWRATSRIEGRGFVETEDLYRALARETLDKLTEDGLLD